MFLAWAIMNHLEGVFHRQESAKLLEAVRKREKTGRHFLFEACDGKFWDEDLNDEGNDFAQSYYAGEGNLGQFLTDYANVFAHEGSSLYHVADTWENYDRFAPVITRRYLAWKAAGKDG
jgi:hypothetical protein